jgi:hypothetical protein
MAAFTWGPGGSQMTPEEIAVQRKVAQAMMAQGSDYSPVQSWSQGAARVAQAIFGGMQARDANEAAKANAASETALIGSLFSGGAPTNILPPAAAAAATAPAAAASPAVAASNPDQAPAPVTFRPGITAPTGDAASAIASIESGGKYELLGPVTKTGDRAYGKYQVMGANVPQWTKAHLGREMTPQEFLASPEAQDAVFKGQFGQYAQKYGPEGAAKAWFAGERGMNNPNARDQLGTSVQSYADRFRKAYGGAPAPVASADPAALPVNAQSAEGYAIPGQPAPAVQAVAQAMPAGVNPRIMAAMASPYISDGTKKVLGIMLTNQLSQDAVSTVDLGNKVAVMDKRGNVLREIPKGEPNKGPEYGVIGKDAFGNEQYGWRDPRDKSTTPVAQLQGGAQPTITGSDGKPIPIPPGVDPKVIREAASKRIAEESMPASSDTTSKLRNEIQGLPSYKNIAQAAPVYKSMLDAAGRDNRAADVNMIYGMAKIMDPGSVVRESEMTVAQAVATLPQQLQAAIKSQLAESGRLTPEIRAAIMTEARSRIGAYQAMFDQDANMYRGIAQRGRMNEADVLPTFGPFDEFKPPAPSKPVVIDGYTIKAK